MPAERQSGGCYSHRTELAAQLPIFVRGVFYEGWDPTHTPEHARDVDSFLARIAGKALLAGETEASVAASAASRVLNGPDWSLSDAPRRGTLTGTRSRKFR